MVYLRKKGDVNNIIIESENGSSRPPLFYLGRQFNFYELRMADSIPVLTNYLQSSANPGPNYVIMSGKRYFDQRLTRLKKLFPGLRQEVIIKSSFVDNLAYWLNPRHNKNEDWYIYKID